MFINKDPIVIVIVPHILKNVNGMRPVNRKRIYCGYNGEIADCEYNIYCEY